MVGKERGGLAKEERGEEREKVFMQGCVHSEQFGELAITAVTCLLMDLRVGFEEVSRRMISWRLEGGRVKRIGMDMFALGWCLVMLGRC
jgi:hypothetical protein